MGVSHESRQPVGGLSKKMELTDFDYHLPAELIAQEPLPERQKSRLLVLHRGSGNIVHRHFEDLPEYLNSSDLLVFNDTRVIPARIFGRKLPSGGRVEILLVRQAGHLVWEALVRPGRRIQVGQRIELDGGRAEARVIGRTSGGRLLEFTVPGDFREFLSRAGLVPLPPYIHRPLEDQDRYQTVYAARDGSVAAPTAGLHFTPGMLRVLKERGVKSAFVTLHIGPGTFRPVKSARIEEHEMDEEYYFMEPAARSAILEARREGRRIVAVGTTAARTLESAFDDEGNIVRECGITRLFIYPGYRFKVVRALITNFHLPRSTLLMLVSAMAGREAVLAAYREALEHRYRFYSFGDAMFVV